MSLQLINHNPDLKRLRDEGYTVRVEGGYLLVEDISHLNARGEVKVGMLVSALDLNGNQTTKPSSHVVFFAGDYPHDKNGRQLAKIKHQSQRKTFGSNIVVQHSFSSKPKLGYADYYEKMSTYASIISSPACSVDPDVTPRPYRAIETSGDESVFQYIDTATSRANIGAVTEKLRFGSVAIVGLGGTGSYVLDLVAKTPVQQIMLFDGDDFSQHNAFRSPGAPPIEVLKKQPTKASYFQQAYSNIHKKIIAHDVYIDTSNVEQLRDADFVFLCLDNGSAKKLIVEHLEGFGTPFIDTGIGVQLVNEKLRGEVRITASTPEKRDHLERRVSFAEDIGDNAYSQNIQIADLNMLNASLAVIRWKRLAGFYHDFDHEYHSVYTVDGNCLTNDECL